MPNLQHGDRRCGRSLFGESPRSAARHPDAQDEMRARLMAVKRGRYAMATGACSQGQATASAGHRVAVKRKRQSSHADSRWALDVGWGTTGVIKSRLEARSRNPALRRPRRLSIPVGFPRLVPPSDRT